MCTYIDVIEQEDIRMKKDLGIKPLLAPMPVLMIATYGDGDKVDVMNMAWGGICGSDQVVLNISADHKTTENLKKRGAFTLSVADGSTMKESDFFGMASGNKMDDKFERSGMHAVKSSRVDAPVIEEYPVTLECKVAEIVQGKTCLHVYGDILNVLADERVLNEDGSVDIEKVDPLVFDTFQRNYYHLGKQAGGAWNAGKELLK
jgi:flavin reductase (DIM6/NTAB) family NADH-FMN oxidoreductase RutF